MVVNWLEIGLIVALNAAILAGVAVMGVRFFRKRLLPEAEMWMGGAIGRFMSNLTKQATEEEGEYPSGSPAGAFELGGFKINAETLGMIAEYGPKLLQLAQQFGFLKGGGGGGGSNPFLKP